jgi:hypothetical protein
MSARRLYDRRRSQCTVRTPAAAINAAAANARTTLILALAGLGLIDVIDNLGVSWSSLATILLLAALATAFFVLAQHSHDKRFAWLLSAGTATGLAIANSYTLINTAPAGVTAVLITIIAILLLVVRGITRDCPRS